tara:strand:- start:7247 stop:14818 length:7572 start_codon:yes stop_codon:yes gene_type:complete
MTTRNAAPFIKLINNILREMEDTSFFDNQGLVHSNFETSYSHNELPITDTNENGIPYPNFTDINSGYDSEIYDEEREGGAPDRWYSRTQYFFQLASEHEIVWDLNDDGINYTYNSPKELQKIGTRRRYWLSTDKILNSLPDSAPADTTSHATSKKNAVKRIEFLCQLLKMSILIHDSEELSEDVTEWWEYAKSIGIEDSIAANTVYGVPYAAATSNISDMNQIKSFLAYSDGYATFEFTSPSADGQQQNDSINDTGGTWSSNYTEGEFDNHAEGGWSHSSLDPSDRSLDKDALYQAYARYDPDGALPATPFLDRLGGQSVLQDHTYEANPTIDLSGEEFYEAPDAPQLTPALRWERWETRVNFESFLFWAAELIELLDIYYASGELEISQWSETEVVDGVSTTYNYTSNPYGSSLPIFSGGKEFISYPGLDRPQDTEEQILLEQYNAGYDNISTSSIESMTEELDRDDLLIPSELRQWWCDFLSLSGAAAPCIDADGDGIVDPGTPGPEGQSAVDISKCTTEEEDVVEACFECVPNPNAFVANWTNLNDGASFFNEKTCEYSVVVRLETENPYEADTESAISEGIDRLLESYGRASILTVSKSDDGVWLEVTAGGDPDDSLVEYTKDVLLGADLVKDYLNFDAGPTGLPHINDDGLYMPTTPLIKSSALVSIPAALFDKIPIDLAKTTDVEPMSNDPLDPNPLVQILGSEIKQMINETTEVIRFYALQYAAWAQYGIDASGENFGELNLVLEAERLESFREDALIILKSKGFVYNRTEKISINFSTDIKKIEDMTFNEAGCGAITVPGSAIESLISNGDIKGDWYNQRSLTYIQRLPDMWMDSSAREPLEWNEYIIKYTFNLKNTQELSGSLNDCAILSDPSLLIDAGGPDAGPFDLLFKDIVDSFLSVPDAAANRFNQMICSGTGYKELDSEMFESSGLLKRAMDTAFSEFFAGDEVGQMLPTIIEAYRGGDNAADGVADIWAAVFNKYGWCGIMALLDLLLGCLLQGIPSADGLKLILQSAVKSLDTKEFASIFKGLTEEQQDQIAAQVSESLGAIVMSPPWENGSLDSYSYSSGGDASSSDVSSRALKKGQELYDSYGGDEAAIDGFSDWPPEDAANYYYYRTGLSEEDGSYVSGTDAQELLESQYPPDTFMFVGSSFKGATWGTLGNEADKVADAIYDAYVEVLLDSLNAEEIEESLKSIKGAGLITQIFDTYKCKVPTIFDPPMKDFFKGLRIDCWGNVGVKIPKLRKLTIPDFWKLLYAALVETIINTVITALLNIITTIIKYLLDAMCKALNAMAVAIADVATPDFRESFCSLFPDDDVCAEECDQTAARMMEALSGCEPNALADNATEFISDLSLILTGQQLVDVLNGDAAPPVLNMINEIATLKYPDTFGSCEGFRSTASTGQLFKAMGNIIPDKYKKLPEEACRPLQPSLCGPDALGEFEDFQCKLMSDKGLTPEQCVTQLDNLRSRLEQDISQLSDLKQQGGFDPLPPIFSDDPCSPGLLPKTDPVIAEGVAETTKSLMSTIAKAHSSDLGGRKTGLLSQILASKRGMDFNTHVRRIEDYAANEFPTTVAGHLKVILNNLNSVVQYSTAEGDSTATTTSIWGVDRPRQFVTDMENKYLGHSVAILEDLGEKTMPTTSLKEPDLELSFSDYRTSDDNDKFGFSLSYSSFETEENNDTSILNDYYKIRIVDDIETEDGDIAGYAGVYGAQREESEIREMISDAANGLNLDIEDKLLDSKSPRNSIFAKIAMEALKESAPELVGTDLEDANPLMFDFYYEKADWLNQFYLEKIAARIGDISNQSFIHGFPTGYDLSEMEDDDDYDPSSDFGAPQKIYLDSTYKNIFTGESQPIPPELYGGTEDHPAYFISPPTLGGWAGLMNSFLPQNSSLYGCGVTDSTACDFESLSDVHSFYYDKFKDDPRQMGGDSCPAPPAPWNTILDRAAAAGVEMSIRATIRIYAAEAFMKGMPVFSIFEAKFPETFDDCIIDYIIDEMEEDLLGKKSYVHPWKNKNLYYIDFIEQVVQSFGRKIDIGDVEPTITEEIAMKRLNAQQLDWSNSIGKEIERKNWPGHSAAGIMASSGIFLGASNSSAAKMALLDAKSDVEKLKERARISYVVQEDNLSAAKVLLRRYVKEEMDFISGRMKDILKPSISDIHNLFLTNKDFILGSLSAGGPANVASGASGLLDMGSINEAIAARLDIDSSDINAIADTFNDGGDYVPLILEKYVKINEKADASGDPIIDRDDREDLKGIVNLDDLVDYIQSNPGTFDTGLKITDYWDSWEFGLRISNISSNGAMGSIESSLTESEIFATVPVGVGSTSNLQSKAFALSSLEPHYITPLVSVNKNSDNFENNSLGDVVSNMDAFYDAELDCLVADLIDSPRYKLLFDYSISIKRMLSVMTIYVMRSFLPSIGSSDYDSWYKNGGNFVGFGKGFINFDQSNLFKRSKRLARAQFLSFKGTQDPNWKSDDNSEREKEKSSISIPWPSFWWLLNLQKKNTIDPEGNPCALESLNT